MGKNGNHYHIRWSGKSALDWQRFDAGAEAEKSAKQLALLGETYAIEEHGEACPQCMALMKKIPVPDTSKQFNRRYSGAELDLEVVLCQQPS
jgi:hypothetical protein